MQTNDIVVAGRRVYPDLEGVLHLAPGDYGQDGSGKWWVMAPCANSAPIPIVLHVVTEHEDGSISASPSILEPTAKYHGYLVGGQWKSISELR